jgi:hypothetical protein
MARRKRRRRRNPPAVRHHRRRHHRRRVAVFAANPRRRHRRRRFAMNPHRRRAFRHNPPGGIIGATLQGAKDGSAVVVGQVANRKIVGAVNGAFKSLPTTPTMKIAVTAAAAIGVTIAARQLLKGAIGSYARFIAAGAFSEAINCALAQTPIASYLGAYTRRSVAVGAIGPASPSRVRGYVHPGVNGYVQPRVPVAGQVS